MSYCKDPDVTVTVAIMEDTNEAEQWKPIQFNLAA